MLFTIVHNFIAITNDVPKNKNVLSIKSVKIQIIAVYYVFIYLFLIITIPLKAKEIVIFKRN